MNRLSRTAQSDYERARASVTSLTKWIDTLKRENATANDAQVSCGNSSGSRAPIAPSTRAS